MSFLTARSVKASLATAALTLLPVSANAATTMLQSNDYVGISFLERYAHVVIRLEHSCGSICAYW